MTNFRRWCKFNFVGAVGMVVQLTSLTIFNRVAHGHDLFASAIAVEVAVLHNFIWHRRFTWRDRQFAGKTIHQLARFQVSNGLVSILGNVLLMRSLEHWTHLPLLEKNSIVILCCSALNFLLSDVWSFPQEIQVAS